MAVRTHSIVELCSISYTHIYIFLGNGQIVSKGSGSSGIQPDRRHASQTGLITYDWGEFQVVSSEEGESIKGLYTGYKGLV